MGKKSLKVLEKILTFVYNLHLYDTTGEGLFKAFAISLSWVGGVKCANMNDEISIPIVSSLLLFSFALIMEYAIKLVSTKNTISKLLPLIIVFFSVGVFYVSFAKLVDRPYEGVEFIDLYNTTIFLQMIIWFDVIIQLLVGKPNSIINTLEKNLKYIEVLG